MNNKNITQLGQLRKIMQRLDSHLDSTEITLEFFLTALFPTVWDNIQKEMRDQYTKGYLQGREDFKNENS